MVAGNITNTIWQIAEILRGEYKQSEYGRVVLPFTLLRRLDCMLLPTKQATLDIYQEYKDQNLLLHTMLERASGYKFYNVSPWTFEKIVGDPNHVYENLIQYLHAFSEQIRDIFEQYGFLATLERLQKNGLLYPVVLQFSHIDLNPGDLDSMDMSIYYEELIRRFSEISNETAGEHFTPREVIHLMVDLLFAHDDAILTTPGKISTVYDPTAGTGGMLSIADETLKKRNPDARLILFGQELNPESYAICKSELLIKDQDTHNIILGNTLSADGHTNKTFDYMLSNPPFGVEWKKIEKAVRDEHERKGFNGRFGPGLPRVSDGSLLFLLHLIAKMQEPARGGSRIGIVFNGSPLFTGGAGSGESEIRRYIIENDYLEAIIGLPTDMFYNTGISTYIWVLSNHKEPQRQGKIQLINAAEMYQKLRKSLGSKRNEFGAEHIARIVELFGAYEENAFSKIFTNEDFGYRTITVERPLRLNFSVAPERIARLREQKKLDDPEAVISALGRLDANHIYMNREQFSSAVRDILSSANIALSDMALKALITALSERDETADICCDKKGNKEPDSGLRDTENVPLNESVDAYFAREVLPYVPDAWIDTEKRDQRDGKVGIVGYEIPFTRHFYTYTPPRQLEEIDRDAQRLSLEIMNLLSEALG